MQRALRGNLVKPMSLDGRQRSFRLPSSVQPPLDGGVVEPCSSRPLSNGECFSSCRDSTTVAAIAALLGSVSPHAVVWAVTLVIVFTLDGVIGARAFAHIRQEVLEFEPPLANSDASPTIILEGLVVGVGAPTNHLKPHLVLRGTRTSMGGLTLLRNTTSSTATGFHLPSTKVERGYFGDVSTITTAYPPTATFSFDLFLNDQFVKALSV